MEARGFASGCDMRDEERMHLLWVSKSACGYLP